MIRFRIILFLLSLAFGVSFSQTTLEVDSLINRANELADNNFSLAISIISEAKEKSEKIDYKKGLADCYYGFADCYLTSREGELCISNLFKAEKLYKSIGYEKGLADVYNDIALAYDEFEIDVKEGSIVNYYKKSLKLSKKNNNQKDIAATSINLSSYYFDRGNINAALLRVNDAIKISKEYEDYFSLAYAYNMKAIFLETESSSDAERYYLLSMKYFDKVENNSIHKFGPMINLAMIYETSDINKSISLYKDIIEFGIRVNEFYYSKISSNRIKNLYENMGDYKNAYKYSNLTRELSDSLNNVEGEKRMVQLSMQHEFDLEKEQISLEQKKKDIEAEEKLKRTRILGYGIGVVALLLLSVGIVSYRAYKNKKKSNIEIAEKNREITDSINYAKRLQDAILSPSKDTGNDLDNLFVMYKPKDIVSGDFYWVEELNNKVLFSAIDCTGHGVPGAMLSIVGNNSLDNIINIKGITTPSDILTELNKDVYSKLKVKGNREMGDGMDVAFCSIDKDTNILNYAGANNPVYIVREGEVITIKATKKAIGQDPYTEYSNNEFQLQSGDSVYVFSDGYADQFGGDRGKKLGSKKFKNLLVDIQGVEMDSQKEFLTNYMNEWRGEEEQIDDICVIGIKVD